MTRAHTKQPVWTWVCDNCGAVGGDLTYSQRTLPSATDMRNRGWFIAEVWGDRCPRCAAEQCGECRLGLGTHNPADPQCDHHERTTR